MSLLFFRNRRVPLFAPPDPMRESRDAAICFAFGGALPERESRRASRRGDLPDVDLSRIVRIERVSFWGRLTEALGLIAPRYALVPEEWRVGPGLMRPSGAPTGDREMKSAAPDRAA